MANLKTNECKYREQTGEIDYDANTFKSKLMASGFTPNIDSHSNWSDISASELANGNGYTTGGVTLAGVVIAKDNINDRSDVTWNNVVFTATGGSIGPTPWACIVKDTGTPATSTVIGFVDFGGNQTVPSGSTLTITAPGVRSA